MGREERSSVSGRTLVGVEVEASGRIGVPVALGMPRSAEVAVASVANQPRGDLVSPYDPRYMSLRPSDLEPLIERLVEAVDHAGVDAVLAISEAGVVPAFAFAAAVDLPLVIATEADVELPQGITFESSRDRTDGERRTRRIYPLSTGDRVIVVEHHTVTGDSILSCVSALRAEGMTCHQAATVLAVDDDAALQAPRVRRDRAARGRARPQRGHAAAVSKRRASPLSAGVVTKRSCRGRYAHLA